MAHARPPRRSSVGVPLDQLTEFWQVWDCLRDCGWTQVRVGGDPRFVRPGCASGYGQEGFMPVVPPAAQVYVADPAYAASASEHFNAYRPAWKSSTRLQCERIRMF